MNKVGYTYCLIKYVHDPAAAEVLNVGVLMFSKDAKRIAGKFEIHFDRLSSTFANFDGENYRAVIRSMEYSISRLNTNFVPTLFGSNVKDIKDVFRQLVPDLGLSIQFGAVLAGITDDLEYEIEQIFDRLITSQIPQKEKKSRSDEEVWTVYNRPLANQHVAKYIQPKTFLSGDNNWKFNHTFKNENWHILEPTTMDYAQADTMQYKAAKLLGETTILNENKEISKIYILLGEPRLQSLRGAYIKAKNLLNRIPMEKEIIEEQEAEGFATELASYMKEHGVIESGDNV